MLVPSRITLIKNILTSAITLLLRTNLWISTVISLIYLWCGYAKVTWVQHRHLVKVIRESLHSLYKAIGAAVSWCISAGLAGYNTSDLINYTRTSQSKNDAHLTTERNWSLILQPALPARSHQYQNKSQEYNEVILKSMWNTPPPFPSTEMTVLHILWHLGKHWLGTAQTQTPCAQIWGEGLHSEMTKLSTVALT